MDAIRRGAMVQMAKRGIGALGAAALTTNSARTQAQFAGTAPHPSYPYPGDVQTQNNALDAIINDGEYRAQKMALDARYRAAEPIRKKINALRGEGYNLLENAIGLHQRTTDLPALKSTALWWRDHVAMERARKRLSAIEQLENQWQKLISSPMEQLDETFRNAVGAFLAEMQKP